MEHDDDVSTLTLAVLGLIARGPCSAYDVRKVFATTPLGHFSASPGAIYPALKRIESRRWVIGRLANAKTLRPKRVYRISGKGRRVLAERLLRPVTRADITRNLDDVMLRFVFMDKVLETGQIVAFLHQLKSELESYRSVLLGILNSARSGITACERLSMEHGIARTEMTIAWTRRAIPQLLDG